MPADDMRLQAVGYVGLVDGQEPAPGPCRQIGGDSHMSAGSRPSPAPPPAEPLLGCRTEYWELLQNDPAVLLVQEWRVDHVQTETFQKICRHRAGCPGPG